MVLMLEGAPQVLEEFHATGTAQTKHKLHGRLRNLKTGRIGDRVFTENERVTVADLAQRKVQLSYKQGDDYVFCDVQTFDELVLSAAQVGDRRCFLYENEEYKALILDGKLLDIVLPDAMALRVVETGPAQRRGSDAAWKSAKLESELEIMVPLFIEKGELIRVDTQQRKYLGKEAEGKNR